MNIATQRTNISERHISFTMLAMPRTSGPEGSAHTGSHHARAGALALRVSKNICLLGKRLGEAVSNSEGYWRQLLWRTEDTLRWKSCPPKLLLVPIMALSALVIAGMGMLLYKRAWLIPIIVAASLGLICASPWPDQFQRYLMPLSPFLAIGVVVAVYEAGLFLQRLPLRTRPDLAKSAWVDFCWSHSLFSSRL